jgi:hypothetical protein
MCCVTSKPSCVVKRACPVAPAVRDGFGTNANGDLVFTRLIYGITSDDSKCARECQERWYFLIDKNGRSNGCTKDENFYIAKGFRNFEAGDSFTVCL